MKYEASLMLILICVQIGYRDLAKNEKGEHGTLPK